MKGKVDPSPPDTVGLNFMRETVPHVQDLRIRAEDDGCVGLSGEKSGVMREVSLALVIHKGTRNIPGWFGKYVTKGKLENKKGEDNRIGCSACDAP